MSVKIVPAKPVLNFYLFYICFRLAMLLWMVHAPPGSSGSSEFAQTRRMLSDVKIDVRISQIKDTNISNGVKCEIFLEDPIQGPIIHVQLPS